MEKKKVLFISQEIEPYLPKNDLNQICRKLPQAIQEKGKEIRTFMPRYGCINERRNQLHEVIRLSGMNIVVNDADHPIIIKVASIQAARMQVYFIDNEEFFKRKAILKDKDSGEEFADNDERALFFARGVIETIIKLRWAPDVIQLSGWFTGFVPIYLKEMYKNNPLFAKTKIIYSLFDEPFTKELDPAIKDKLAEDNISPERYSAIEESRSYKQFTKMIVENCDAVIYANGPVGDEIEDIVESCDTPAYNIDPNSEDYADKYNEIYDSLISE